MSLPNCPKCNSEYTYEDGELYVCPECFHEWSIKDNSLESDVEDIEEDEIVKDSNGNVLENGDSIIVLKDLKVKGTSKVVKVGTKVKIYLNPNEKNGHNISGKVKGIGDIFLKSEFVKKA